MAIWATGPSGGAAPQDRGEAAHLMISNAISIVPSAGREYWLGLNKFQVRVTYVGFIGLCILLENYQALLWWIVQPGEFLLEKAALWIIGVRGVFLQGEVIYEFTL